jgi:hypothetical protein
MHEDPDEPDWKLEKLINDIDTKRNRKEKERIADEISATRKQQKEQWEYENGGENPIKASPDVESLTPEQKYMFRRLGEINLERERKRLHEPPDSIFPVLLMLILVMGFLFLVRKFQ